MYMFNQLHNVLMNLIFYKTTNLVRFGNFDKHVLSTWVFVFVRMP